MDMSTILKKIYILNKRKLKRKAEKSLKEIDFPTRNAVDRF